MKRLRVGLAIAVFAIASGLILHAHRDEARASVANALNGAQSNDVFVGEGSTLSDSQSEQPSNTADATSGTLSARLVRYDTTGMPHSEQLADRQVPLHPNEKVEIELRPDRNIGNTPIIVSVDHGGIINNQPLKPRVELAASTSRFSFQAGMPRGKYTIHIRQGNNAEVLEFWVGTPQVYGRPGPSRIFTGPSVATGGGAP